MGQSSVGLVSNKPIHQSESKAGEFEIIHKMAADSKQNVLQLPSFLRENRNYPQEKGDTNFARNV